MQKLIKVMRIAILLEMVILSGCSQTGENSKVFPITPAAVTATLHPSLTTSIEDGTPSHLTVSTVSPPTSPSITQTLVVLSTATWMPALSETEAEDMAIDLLRDNGGCRLPCFWGFTPRQVSQETLFSFFHAFYNVGGRSINIPRGNSTIKVSVNWNSDNDSLSVVRSIWVTMTAEREVKQADGHYDQYIFDNPYFQKYIKYYTLPNLLSNYGSPSIAYIGIDPAAQMGGEDLYHLYLDYSKSGWSVHFWMPLKRDGDYYIGCPTQAFISLETWLPGDSAAESENLARIKDYGIFRSFEDMTSLTLEEFYQQFKDPLNTKCLRTPMNKWR